MICQKCGKEITDDSRFCEYCGAKVIKENAVWIKNKFYLTLGLATVIPSLLIFINIPPIIMLVYSVFLLMATDFLYTRKKISKKYANTCSGIILFMIIDSLCLGWFCNEGFIVLLSIPLIACVVGFLVYHYKYSKEDKIINS